jgi:hypothetical protein
MMSDDHAEIFNSLRASTITLLGYDDVEHLSSAQEIRISRAITLRLTIDDLQARQLRGERIDVSVFVEASESLERMCGGVPEGSTRFGADHRAKLQALIERTVLGGDAAAHERDFDTTQADEQQAILAALPLDHEAPSKAPMQRVDPPSPAQPSQQISAQPPPQASDAERQANVDRLNSQPSNPPDNRLANEPWRSHVNADGIIAPWWSGGHG